MVGMEQLIAMLHTALRNKTVFYGKQPELSLVSLLHQMQGTELPDGPAADSLLIEEDPLVALPSVPVLPPEWDRCG